MSVPFHPSLSELADFALAMPEAWADQPWGDPVVKVGKKIFVFVSSADAADPAITVKVPESRAHALSYPGSSPTGYGLGKHGWVTIAVGQVPAEEFDTLWDFVEESYRAVAPKKLIARLDADPPDRSAVTAPRRVPAVRGGRSEAGQGGQRGGIRMAPSRRMFCPLK